MSSPHEKPILMSAPMVRAILCGTKTQTRRLMRRQEEMSIAYRPIIVGGKAYNYAGEELIDQAPVAAGDLLWVREAWQTHCDMDHIKPRDLPTDAAVQYPATYDGWVSRRRPSLHMPRWASRLTLAVTDVRVQRLQDINEEDAAAEGVQKLKSGRGYYSATHGHAAVHFGVYHDYAKEAFADLWDSINGAGAWEANPWVYAVSFAVERAKDAAIAA